MMVNNIEVDFIREYLIENKLEFSRENINEWIQSYAEKFRKIIISGETDKNEFKNKLYKKNGKN